MTTDPKTLGIIVWTAAILFGIFGGILAGWLASLGGK